MPSIGAASPLHVASIPVDFPSLSSDKLAELGGNPEMLEGVRAEVYRRLQDDPRKANFFTFRWLLTGGDDEDRADAFDGLMAVCWDEVKFRHAAPHGAASDWKAISYVRDEIMDALVKALYRVKSLEPSEIISKALTGAFRTDAEVANAVRRRNRRERQTLSLDFVYQYDEEESTTLLEVLGDNADSRTNHYSAAIETVARSEGHFVEVVGERGWQVFWEFVNRIDGDAPENGQRNWERALTEAFQDVYDVKARQATTLKNRFRETVRAAVRQGNPVMEGVAELLGWQ